MLRLRNGATISDEEKVKERWVEHFENVLNRDTIAGKDTDENENFCDTLDVKEDLFSEEEFKVQGSFIITNIYKILGNSRLKV